MTSRPTPSRPARRGIFSGAAVAGIVTSLLVGGAGGLSAQALPFHTASGLTAGFQENAARAFAGFVGRSGRVTRNGSTPRSVEAFVVGTGFIPFSFDPLWTVRVRLPFVSKSMTTGAAAAGPEFETSGVGDLVVDSKWIFYRQDRPGGTRRIGLQGGLKAPAGDTGARLPDGSLASRPLQVGTGSWDVPVALVFTETGRHWGVSGNAGWRLNTEADGFEAGDVFSYDLALGLRFLPWTYESLSDQTLVAYLELNGTVARKDRVEGDVNPASGGHVLFLSPDLQWVPFPWLLFEGSVQVPVVQDLNGFQLEHDTRFQIGSRIRFSVFR